MEVPFPQGDATRWLVGARGVSPSRKDMKNKIHLRIRLRSFGADLTLTVVNTPVHHAPIDARLGSNL